MDVFFDYKDVSTINSSQRARLWIKICVQILCKLCDAIRRNHLEKWTEKSWVLLHDNALAHWPLFGKNYLAEHNVYHTWRFTNTRDLALADFYLFPRLKMKLKWQHSEIQKKLWRMRRDSWWGFQRIIPGVFWRIVWTLEKVCEFKRRLHWRTCRLNCCKYNKLLF